MLRDTRLDDSTIVFRWSFIGTIYNETHVLPLCVYDESSYFFRVGKGGFCLKI